MNHHRLLPLFALFLLTSGTVLIVHDDGKLELKSTGSETLVGIPSDNLLPLISHGSVHFPFLVEGSQLYIFTKTAVIEVRSFRLDERGPVIDSINGHVLDPGLCFLFLITSVALYWNWLKKAGKMQISSNAVRNHEGDHSNGEGNQVPKNSNGEGENSNGEGNQVPENSNGEGNQVPENSNGEGNQAPENSNDEGNQVPENSNGEGNQVPENLLVPDKEIGRGSNGTVVLEGVFEGRSVAVKRLLLAQKNVADNEIGHLYASDGHPNIVRLYWTEQDDRFIYIYLERCRFSLANLISLCSEEVNGTDGTALVGSGVEDMVLWRENGLPSPQLLKLMRDVVSGLVHLHKLRIIHRDMKPENVLVTTEWKAKLCDMGSSIQLQNDMLSVTGATGSGTSGWKAREQLLDLPESIAVDMFSFGCILFFCLTKGNHPFGEYSERDAKITNGDFDLFLLQDFPEAIDLISLLLDQDPEKRPEVAKVIIHPIFWNSKLRISFLKDTSDRVGIDQVLITAIEEVASDVFRKIWSNKVDKVLITTMKQRREYDHKSLSDLLRLIRNISSHFISLPENIQGLLGSHPEGVDDYFSTRFPNLLMEVYKVVSTICHEENMFAKYFQRTFVI